MLFSTLVFYYSLIKCWYKQNPCVSSNAYCTKITRPKWRELKILEFMNVTKIFALTTSEQPNTICCKEDCLLLLPLAANWGNWRAPHYTVLWKILVLVLHCGLQRHCSKDSLQRCWRVCTLHPPYQSYNPLSLSILTHLVSLLSNAEENKTSM
jgi:hypothetical protein